MRGRHGQVERRSAVMSTLARPRTPSVPNSRDMCWVFSSARDGIPSRCRAAGPGGTHSREPTPECTDGGTRGLGCRHRGTAPDQRLEYCGPCGPSETGLLALRDAGVAGQEASFFSVGRFSSSSTPLSERATPRRTAPAWPEGPPPDAHEHVVGTVELEQRERLVDDLLVDLVREVLLERAPVDLHSPVPGTMRTRAMACLRRPVAAPGAEALGRRTASPETGPRTRRCIRSARRRQRRRCSRWCQPRNILNSFSAQALADLLRDL